MKKMKIQMPVLHKTISVWLWNFYHSIIQKIVLANIWYWCKWCIPALYCSFNYNWKTWQPFDIVTHVTCVTIIENMCHVYIHMYGVMFLCVKRWVLLCPTCAEFLLICIPAAELPVSSVVASDEHWLTQEQEIGSNPLHYCAAVSH